MLFPLALVGGAAGQHDLSPRFGSSVFWIGAELVGEQVGNGNLEHDIKIQHGQWFLRLACYRKQMFKFKTIEILHISR